MFQQLELGVTSSEFLMPGKVVFGNKCERRKLLLCVACVVCRKKVRVQKSQLFKPKHGRRQSGSADPVFPVERQGERSRECKTTLGAQEHSAVIPNKTKKGSW